MHITATLFAGALLFPVAIAAQMSSGAIEAQQALTGMDSRRALPLPPMMANHQKQNMRDHLVGVQEIVAAMVDADFTAAERAAGRIGYSEQIGQNVQSHGCSGTWLYRAGAGFSPDGGHYRRRRPAA